MSLQNKLVDLSYAIERIPASAQQTDASTKLSEIISDIRQKSLNNKLTGNVFDDLEAMHRKYGFDKKPLSKKELRQRIDFLQEELDEIKKAFDDSNSEEMVDGLEDLIVVAVGTLDLAKVDGEKGWYEVMNANLAKKVGFNEKRPNSDGNDLIKPEGWKAPNHSTNVGVFPEVLFQEYDHKYFPESDEKKIVVSFSTEFKRFSTPNEMSQRRRFALQFLEDCKAFMLQKAADYNNEISTVKSADYYQRGADDLLFNIREKYLRITSVLDIMRNGGTPNFDSLNDSLRDLSIFSAMFAEYINFQMDGQIQGRDIFNKEIKTDDSK